MVILILLIMKTLIIMIIIMILLMMMNIEKLAVLEHYLKNQIEIITNPIRIDGGFAEENDNYVEYTSKGERYENLSPEEYLNVIRPCLRDLINEHKPTVELNNNNNNNNNTDNNNNIDNNNNNNNKNNRAEWKIQIIIKNNFISVKGFEDTCTIYLASKPVEIFMGSDTKNIIGTLFDTILNKIQQAMETSNERESGFTHESVGLLYYHFKEQILEEVNHI